ncbi:unnamed protein product [Prorocentrum cordatum]|uniref:Uncharacterized protein n=1 Tax=Prorocentrum cordatum TaxID=2364126 RepID=A0ABN9QXM7_9DINO|nr:unnamed protein product [Polarella glacialis]
MGAPGDVVRPDECPSNPAQLFRRVRCRQRRLGARGRGRPTPPQQHPAAPAAGAAGGTGPAEATKVLLSVWVRHWLGVVVAKAIVGGGTPPGDDASQSASEEVHAEAQAAATPPEAAPTWRPDFYKVSAVWLEDPAQAAAAPGAGEAARSGADASSGRGEPAAEPAGEQSLEDAAAGAAQRLLDRLRLRALEDDPRGGPGCRLAAAALRPGAAPRSALRRGGPRGVPSGPLLSVRCVRFNLGASTVHYVKPYREIYGAPLSQLRVDEHMCLVPRGDHASSESDDDDSEDEHGEHEPRAEAAV